MRVQQFFTPEQVANYLQLNRETVYNLVKSGDLGAIKIGRYYRISEDDFTRFMFANRANKEYGDALTQRVREIAERNKHFSSEEIERDVDEAVRAVRRQSK